jgi:hypothetical protein
MRPRVTIGDFSRASHLSVKTLRHYHEVGLLELAQTREAVGELRDLLQPRAPHPIEHHTVEPTPAIGIEQTVDRDDIFAWWQGALGELHATLRAQSLIASGPAGGLRRLLPWTGRYRQRAPAGFARLARVSTDRWPRGVGGGSRRRRDKLGVRRDEVLDGSVARHWIRRTRAWHRCRIIAPRRRLHANACDASKRSGGEGRQRGFDRSLEALAGHSAVPQDIDAAADRQQRVGDGVRVG